MELDKMNVPEATLLSTYNVVTVFYCAAFHTLYLVTPNTGTPRLRGVT